MRGRSFQDIPGVHPGELSFPTNDLKTCAAKFIWVVLVVLNYCHRVEVRTLAGRSGLSADFSTACRLPPGMLFVRGARPHSRCPPSPDVNTPALGQQHFIRCTTLRGVMQAA